MNAEAITNITAETFQSRAAGKRVILLYPWANYRNVFLTHFLKSSDAGLLYYRVPDGIDNLAAWLDDMRQEFVDALGQFGNNLTSALQQDSPAAYGEALAADLATYQANPIVLFIDELDRLPLDDAMREFARALVEALPDHVQLAISSRLLTYAPWYGFVQQGIASVMGTEFRSDNGMFTLNENPRPQLEVYSLGRGYAIVNGRHITNWDGALPRNLFFYFMDHPLVTRDEIFETFWPDLSVKEATNVFHVTKRKISERISMQVMDGKNYELTQYSGGFYMPSEKVIRHYDVAYFQDAIERSMTAMQDDEEERLLAQAIDLYRAPFLQTVDMRWARDRRDHLRQLYAQALISMGRIHKRRDNLEHALGFFVRSLKETPEREDIHREVMNLYLQLDMVSDARMQYHTLERILRDTLGIGPSRESRELFDTIESRS